MARIWGISVAFDDAELLLDTAKLVNGELSMKLGIELILDPVDASMSMKLD
jgi:hypothetical protein